ncbi:hypothetical protein ACWEIJ_26035 [Lentzea sp. NPDC004789]
MNISVRAFTGAAAGALGVVATAMVWMILSSTGSCRFEKPYDRFSEHCDGLAAYALLWQPLVVLAGLAGTAVLHGWWLQARHEPRPWSVVALGIGLVVLLMMLVWSSGLMAALLLVPPVAFAIAGAVTGFGGADAE